MDASINKKCHRNYFLGFVEIIGGKLCTNIAHIYTSYPLNYIYICTKTDLIPDLSLSNLICFGI